MAGDASLLDHYRAYRPDTGVAAAEVLRELVDAGAAAWPDVELDPAIFVRHLALHTPKLEDAAGWLATLHAADLHLACACAEGLPSALAAFDAKYLSHLDLLVARARLSTDEVDELRQRLRESLFLPREGKPARIADYAGRGPLEQWLRVAALRTASNLRRSDRARPDNQDETSGPEAIAAIDPELAVIRRRLGDDFTRALREAFERLDPRDRSLVRMHFSDRLGIDQLAPIFQISRATAARWLKSAREALVQGTLEALRARLKMSQDELESLLGVVRSKLEFSLGALLREPGNEPPKT